MEKNRSLDDDEVKEEGFAGYSPLALPPATLTSLAPALASTPLSHFPLLAIDLSSPCPLAHTHSPLLPSKLAKSAKLKKMSKWVKLSIILSIFFLINALRGIKRR